MKKILLSLVMLTSVSSFAGRGDSATSRVKDSFVQDTALNDKIRPLNPLCARIEPRRNGSIAILCDNKEAAIQAIEYVKSMVRSLDLTSEKAELELTLQCMDSSPLKAGPGRKVGVDFDQCGQDVKAGIHQALEYNAG